MVSWSKNDDLSPDYDDDCDGYTRSAGDKVFEYGLFALIALVAVLFIGFGFGVWYIAHSTGEAIRAVNASGF